MLTWVSSRFLPTAGFKGFSTDSGRSNGLSFLSATQPSRLKRLPVRAFVTSRTYRLAPVTSVCVSVCVWVSLLCHAAFKAFGNRKTCIVKGSAPSGGQVELHRKSCITSLIFVIKQTEAPSENRTFFKVKVGQSLYKKKWPRLMLFNIYSDVWVCLCRCYFF